MALDALAQATVNEVINAVNGAQGQFQNPVRISPRHMRAMILLSQQQIRWQRPDGQIVTLVEDAFAPPVATAVAEGIEAPTPREPFEPSEDELQLLREMRARRAASLQGVGGGNDAA